MRRERGSTLWARLDREIPLVNIMKSLAVCTFLLVAALPCCMSATNTTASNSSQTADAKFNPNGSQYCPFTCFCDFESSLVSCAGTDEETGFGNNKTAINVALPGDLWSIVAKANIQRLDVRDLILERVDGTLVNGTEGLSELSLVDCGLAFIANATFSHHSNLERLDLSQNQLTVLSQVKKKKYSFINSPALVLIVPVIASHFFVRKNLHQLKFGNILFLVNRHKSPFLFQRPKGT